MGIICGRVRQNLVIKYQSLVTVSCSLSDAYSSAPPPASFIFLSSVQLDPHLCFQELATRTDESNHKNLLQFLFRMCAPLRIAAHVEVKTTTTLRM